MATDPFVPEFVYTDSLRVCCDGATDESGSSGPPDLTVACGASRTRFISPALGHPRVWLQIDDKGYVDCGYCDKRFILKGGRADEGAFGA